MYIRNRILESIPGVVEICEAEEAWREYERENPNKEGKMPNAAVVGPPDIIDDLDEVFGEMTVEDTKKYLAWWDKNLELYAAYMKLIETYPYAQKAICLDIAMRNEPREGTIKAIERLTAGDDYKAVLDEYEANPGDRIGDGSW